MEFKMGLKPKDKTVANVFEQIDYEIDFYQREYKWSDDTRGYKPVKSLLDDIFYRFNLDYQDNLDPTAQNLNEFEWYYLNSFMTNTVDGKKFVVDGQQRLTTLTLIQINLYHMSKIYNLPSNLIDSLKKSIYGSTDFGTSYCMGVKDRKNSIEHLFKNHLTEYKESDYETVSEKNIYKNYKGIANILNDYLVTDDIEKTKNKLHFFILYFRNKVYLIEIEIEKTKDVPMVFEVINDRGIPLKPYEILKGKILGQINKNDVASYLGIWEDRIVKLEAYGEEEIDDFFSFYFKSKYSDSTEQYKKLDKARYHKSIFTEDFNLKIGLKHNQKNVKEFVEKQLSYYSDLYLFLLDKYQKYSKEYEHIYFNMLNDIDGQFPLILSCLVSKDPEEKEKIKLVSQLYDRNFVILNLTNSYDSVVFSGKSLPSLIKNIRQKSIKEIKKEFDTQLIKDIKKSKDLDNLKNPFRYEFFRNIGYTTLGKKFLRYFFARIEHYLSDISKRPAKGYEQLVLYSKGQDMYHIEHIITNNEKNLLLFNGDEEEFNIQRNRLGGLLLLKGKDNISSGNELYADKMSTYNVNGTLYSQTLLKDNYKSNVEFTHFISAENLNFKYYDVFGKEEIEERQLLLFELVQKIWDISIEDDIDFEDVELIDEDFEEEDNQPIRNETINNEDIQKLHELIFVNLYDRHKQNQDFQFTVRQKNNKERLDKGYWFVGDDNYLITSFWSGRDWKNKTPYINLIFLPPDSIYRERLHTKDCCISFVCKDNDDLRIFYQKIFEKIEGIIENGTSEWVLPIAENGYIECIDLFIKKYKPIIDECIALYKPEKINFLDGSNNRFIQKIVNRRNGL